MVCRKGLKEVYSYKIDSLQIFVHYEHTGIKMDFNNVGHLLIYSLNWFKITLWCSFFMWIKNKFFI